MDIEPYENLVNAIILRAILDYKCALGVLVYVPRDREALREKREIEQFFRSQWFSDICDADGEKIIQALKLKFKRKKETA